MLVKKFSFLAIVLALSFAWTSCDDDDKDDASKPTEFQTALKGTYVPLFTAVGMTGDKWDPYWVECCKIYTDGDEEAAKNSTSYLQYIMTSTIYGADAVSKYGTELKEGSEFRFNCDFINGVAKLTFNGRNITGYDSEGKKVFSHNYTYFGKFSDSTFGMNFDKYKSDDDNADEFTYFYFADDTPATTQHIEFRYGSSEAELGKILEGKYAYWLAAGMLENADDDMVKKCIKLFVDENLGNED